jgi:hypothetical protein
MTMAMDKKSANQVLQTLDDTAGRLEKLKVAGKINPKVADGLIKQIDTFADRVQVAAFGKESFQRFQAKVIQKDSDEKFMDTFDNPNKVIQSDSDEPYMHKAPPSFNSKGIDTYDQDGSAAVSERKEYDIRDLNEYAGGTKKQPTWPGGSAGKSTKQGSTKPAPRPAAKPVAKPAKTWA